MDRMMIVFFICVLVMVISAYIEKKPESAKSIVLEKGMFNTGIGFKITSLVIIAILIFIYTIWW